MFFLSFTIRSTSTKFPKIWLPATSDWLGLLSSRPKVALKAQCGWKLCLQQIHISCVLLTTEYYYWLLTDWLSTEYYWLLTDWLSTEYYWLLNDWLSTEYYWLLSIISDFWVLSITSDFWLLILTCEYWLLSTEYGVWVVITHNWIWLVISDYWVLTNLCYGVL